MVVTAVGMVLALGGGEAGDADKHPAVCGTAPRQNFPAHNVNGTEAVTSCFRVSYVLSRDCAVLRILLFVGSL